jgi:transcriptional regulator
MTDVNTRVLDRELKKGSAELIILSILEPRARHGYEISKLIEMRSGGQMKFHVASLYPLLYRLEERGWLQGRWVEKAGERRRRFYSLTAEGRRVLSRQRETWEERFQELRSSGVGAEDARRLTLEELLDENTLAEHLRALRANSPRPAAAAARRSLAGDAWQDVRYTVRSLRKSSPASPPRPS